jgi:hypothetical protein
MPGLQLSRKQYSVTQRAAIALFVVLVMAVTSFSPGTPQSRKSKKSENKRDHGCASNDLTAI